MNELFVLSIMIEFAERQQRKPEERRGNRTLSKVKVKVKVK
jgi:hypothetical protein